MRPRRMRRLAAGVTFALLVAAAGVASAWVRSTTDKGTPIFWPQSCTWFFADSAGMPDIPFENVNATLTKSIAAWQNAAAGCSYLVIHQDAPEVGEAKLDRKNVLKFRTDKWCRPAEKNNVEMCFAATAAAITTVFYVANPGQPDDGSIIDADIEMNSINFTFVIQPSTTTARPNTQIADLENTLTHELGHFLGLDHTCRDPGQTTMPIDGTTGQVIPECTALGNLPVAERARITQATMYNYAQPGEISKRTPKPDDIAGVCATYPTAKSPGSCVRPDAVEGGGCAMARLGTKRSGSALGALLAGAVLAGLIVVRRRRRRA